MKILHQERYPLILLCHKIFQVSHRSELKSGLAAILARTLGEILAGTTLDSRISETVGAADSVC